jgi:hypothetical protein
MLYNKDWDKPLIKTDPHSMEAFAAWLATKEPTESYSFHDLEKCAVGQWVRYCDSAARPDSERVSGCDYRIYGEIQSFRSMVSMARFTPRTFGALLDRVKAALK